MAQVVARVEVSEQELRSWVSEYHQALGLFLREVDEQRYRGGGPNGLILQRYLINVFTLGRKIGEAVLATRAVPAAKAKPLEMGIRVLNKALPKWQSDIVGWADKNLKYLLTLEDSAGWPLKAEGTGDDLFRVGPFLVHNTLALSGDKLAKVRDLLEQGVEAAKRVPLPGYERVLYGDVFISGQLLKSKTLAWYNPAEDDIYVRPNLKVGYGEVHHFVHELSHRYWRKVGPGAVKQAFMEYDDTLRSPWASVPYPKAGEPLPVPLKPGEEPPVVTEVKPSLRGMALALSTGGYVLLDSYMDFARATTKSLRFPTIYSMTGGVEEHFCDTVALYATGKLTGEHLAAFKAIARGQDPAGPSLEPTMGPIHTAGTYVHIEREDLEDWLDSIQFLSEKWYVKRGTVGVYVLPLSDFVAVELSSTVGRDDSVMGKGQASMQLRLVSRITGQTINKKAQGQSHFARTTNWRKTWLDGVERMRAAYLQSAGFYDAVAEIEDRDRYQREITQRIEARYGWQGEPILHQFHDQVARGGVLTRKQKDLLVRLLDQKPEAPPSPPAHVPARVDEGLLDRIRNLWRKGRDSNDLFVMTFAKGLGEALKSGKGISPNDKARLDKELARYKVAARVAARYLARTQA